MIMCSARIHGFDELKAFLRIGFPMFERGKPLRFSEGTWESIPAYYTRCSFDYEIKRYDPHTGFYTIREIHDLQVCTARSDVKVPLDFRWREAQHDGQSIKIHSLRIDQDDQLALVKEGTDDGALTVSVGTSDDFTDLLQNEGSNSKRMHYDKPIFPRQGFMLVFRPV